MSISHSAPLGSSVSHSSRSSKNLSRGDFTYVSGFSCSVFLPQDFICEFVISDERIVVLAFVVAEYV